jgi:coenzyme Q-binding protein COQ10
MPEFSTRRRVRHSAAEMFELVADVEHYPEFVPLCRALEVRKRIPEPEGVDILIADMTVAYKFVRETFSSRVTLDRANLQILVEYLDGPFSKLENRWLFHPTGEQSCEVEFFISYEFKSRTLALLMGSMFDVAFRRFATAFERRADVVYARKIASGERQIRLLVLRQLAQQRERLDDTGVAHLLAPDVAVSALAVDELPATRRGGEMHEPDRLAGDRAARSGNAGDRDSEIDRRVRERARCHGLRGLGAHGAVAREGRCRDPEHRLLGLVAVGDEAALEHVGGAGDLGERRGDEPASAGFRGGDLERLPPAELEQRLRLRDQFFIHHLAAPKLCFTRGLDHASRIYPTCAFRVPELG